MPESPINILGAGPASLCAAITLAKEGRNVHVHERYDVIGKRFLGDLQGIENWSTEDNVLTQLRTFGIDTTFAMTPFSEVTITDGKKSFLSSSKEPLFYLVKRGPFPDTLDSALSAQAQNAGVKIHYRSTIAPQSAHIIGTGPIRQSIIAIDKGLVFETDLPNMAVGIFDDELAYLGYSYLLIANGYGCVCSVVFKDFHRLNPCFERTVELAKRIAPIKLDQARSAGGQGSFVLNHPLISGSSLLVGEAAGLQDLLWGFGIRTALTSGYLAAQCLLTQQDYPTLVHQKLYPGMKAGIVTRCLWETLKWNNKPLLPYLLRLPASCRTLLHSLYSFSLGHRMLYPFALKYIKKHYPSSIEETPTESKAIAPPKETTVKVGDHLPSFKIRDDEGYDLTEEDLIGGPVVLYFYPKDETPTCTEEACAFRDSMRKLESLDAIVIGVSPDSAESHREFSKHHHLNFTLLSDESLDLCRKFGVLHETPAGPRLERTTFVINPEGVICWIDHPKTMEGHIEKVIKALQENHLASV